MDPALRVARDLEKEKEMEVRARGANQRRLGRNAQEPIGLARRDDEGRRFARKEGVEGRERSRGTSQNKRDPAAVESMRAAPGGAILDIDGRAIARDQDGRFFCVYNHRMNDRGPKNEGAP